MVARGKRGDAAESGFPYANDGAELADSRKRQAEFAQRRKRLEKEMLLQEHALECAARCAARFAASLGLGHSRGWQLLASRARR